MNRLIAAAFLFSAIAGTGMAHALSLVPPVQAPGPDIIAVAGGCGPGFHPRIKSGGMLFRIMLYRPLPRQPPSGPTW